MGQIAAKYDYVIVGGGILGLLIAYKLSKSTDKSILIIDKGEFGNGATLRSAALSSALASSVEIFEATRDSQNFYYTLQQETDEAFCFPLETFFCTKNPNFSNQYITEFEQVNSPEFPNWVKSGDLSVFTSSLAWYYNPTILVKVLLNELKKVPTVSLQPFTTALSVNENQLKTNKGSVWADKIVLSTGPWNIEERNSEKINNKRIISFIVERPVSKESGVLYFPDRGAFLLPRVDQGNWLLSVTSNEWGIDPDNPNLNYTPRDWRLAEDFSSHYLNTNHLSAGSVFCDGYTADKFPLIEKLSDAIISVRGGSGRGIRFAPTVARQVMKDLEIEMKAKTLIYE